MSTNDWVAVLDSSTNRTYYANMKTRETTWIKPCDYVDEQQGTQLVYNQPGQVLHNQTQNVENIALNKYCIVANIDERYSSLQYQFDFENKNDDTKSNSELQFELTIDSDAFISKFVVNIDDEIFIGKVKEKNIAKKEYDTAKREKKNAILIFQPQNDIPNVFTIKITLNPKSKASLNISVEQYLKKIQNYNQLNIEILNNFSNVKYINIKDIVFKFYVNDIRGIHDININANHNQNLLMFDKKEINKTKAEIFGKINYNKNQKINELILLYKVMGENNESNVLYDSKNNTFCHIISDIFTDATIENDEGGALINKNQLFQIPRRCIFLLDQSGSMFGIKWNQTINSTIYALEQLNMSCDRYCLILFNHSTEYLTIDKIQPASKENVSLSIHSLQQKLQRPPFGGTNINDGLMEAIDLIKNDIQEINKQINNVNNFNFFANQILFITDGEANEGVQDAKQIILNVKKHNILTDIDKYSDKISIFSFGIGRDENDSNWTRDLNHSFLKLLSVNNNGIYKRIKKTNTNISLSKYFDILSKPTLMNINISYKNQVQDLTNTNFHTLYFGDDIIVCGRCKNNNSLTVVITATTAQQSKQNTNELIIKPTQIRKEIKTGFNNDYTGIDGNIDRIWAYLKLQQYSTQKLIHTDMIEYDDDEKTNDESIPLSLAMKYKFVTEWTSMIVVKDSEKKVDDNNDEPIEPNDYATVTTSNIQTNVGMINAQMAISSGSVIHFDAAWGSDSDEDDNGDDSWDDECEDDSSSSSDGLEVYDPNKQSKTALNNTVVNDNDGNVLIVDIKDRWDAIEKEEYHKYDKFTFDSFASKFFDVTKHSSMLKKKNVSDLTKYCPYKEMKHSLLKMDKKLDKVSQSIWYFVNKYISTETNNDKRLDYVIKLLRLLDSTDNSIINDELFCQLYKQTIGNPSHTLLLQTWKLISICCGVTCPSKNNLAVYFVSYLHLKSKQNDLIGKYASFALKLLYQARGSPRKKLPTTFELMRLENMELVPIQLWFLDNTFKSLRISPHMTIKNMKEALIKNMNIKYSDSFSIYQMENEEAIYYEWDKIKHRMYENRKGMGSLYQIDELERLSKNGIMPVDKELKLTDKIMDIYSSWVQRNSQVQKENLVSSMLIDGYINNHFKVYNKSKTIPNDVKCIVLQYYDYLCKIKEYKFVFKCRLQCSLYQPLYNSKELQLSYLSIKWNLEHVVYPILSRQDICHLYAMHLQFDSAVNEIDKYVISNHNINLQQYKDEILATQKLYNDLNMKELYLKYINYLDKSVLYYDCKFFPVIYLSTKSQTIQKSDLLLGISQNGLILLDPIQLTMIRKQGLAEILSYGVRARCFVLVAGGLMTQTKYQFGTLHGQEINDLIRDYIASYFIIS